MFRILLVDDDPDLTDNLKEFLEFAMADVVVDTAANVKQGIDMIDEAWRSGRTYDVAVLDFQLPFDETTPKSIDEKLCNEMSQKAPEALVIHLTGHPDDPQVVEHMIKCHTGIRRTVAAEPISKDADSGAKLLNLIRTFLYSTDTANEVQDIRPARNSTGVGTRTLPRTHGRNADNRSLTHRLGQLERHIVERWPYLNEETKALVKSVFVVTEGDGKVGVSLLKG